MLYPDKIFDLVLERSSTSTLSSQIYKWIYNSITNGEIRVGETVPSSRELSRRIGCSRNTVLFAYEQLIAEGLLDTQPGHVTTVGAHFPDKTLADRNNGGRRKQLECSGANLSNFGERLVELESRIIDRRRPAFAESQPDVRDFPFHIWTRISNRIWRKPDLDLLYGYDRRGVAELRVAISCHLLPRRGFEAHADCVLVTSGASHAIELASQLLLNPGDQVVVEDPGYLGWRALSAFGFDVVPVPLDSEGIKVDLIAELAPRAKLIAVTPSHQMPTGIIMSARRREELLDYAERWQTWIIEDDYDADFRYSGLPLSALKARDRAGRVIYVGTFSKIIFPTLRLGYLVAEADLVEKISRARTFLDCFSSVPMQPVLAQFIQEGHFERHSRRLRRSYFRRQNVLLELSDRYFSGYICLKQSDAGIHVLGTLGRKWPASISDTEFSLRADAIGVTLRPLSDYYQKAPKQQGFIMGYGGIPADRMEREIAKVAAILPVAADL